MTPAADIFPSLNQSEKIQVCCPMAVTGGPELLHQLVHELRKIGKNASIVYLPLGADHACPAPYQIYDAPQSRLADEPGVLVVVPEVASPMLWKLKHATGVIWWLSVDYYFEAKGEDRFRDLIRSLRALAAGRRIPLWALHKQIHLAQSQYAIDFLAGAGIAALALTDYLSWAHLRHEEAEPRPKADIIAYNPRKGARTTALLRRAHSSLEFVPIANMSADQVAAALGSAKLYIDFGHHPGKDRLPREAALAGCCVVTGRRGAAANSRDIPVPELYKIDESRAEFVESFGNLARSILGDYPSHCTAFEQYREGIRGEYSVFQRQVQQLFGRPGQQREL